jgi:hypothetical protein
MIIQDDRGIRQVYAGVLDIPEGKSGDFELQHVHRQAGTVMRSGNMRTMLYGQAGASIKFEEPTRWHQLLEDGGVWMTDDPIEQRQHDEALTDARGHVLVGGLGLGYAVVALARNRRVKSITVVEKSQDVVNLTWDATVARVKTFRPTFKRLNVVVMDLFKYLKTWDAVLDNNTVGKPFNWAFYDIWQSDGEATFHQVVIPLRKLSRDRVGTVVCWNEDIMRGQLAMGLESRIRFIQPHPDDETKSVFGMPLKTAAEFAEPHNNVWWDWAVPFWEWVRDNNPSIEEASVRSQVYAQEYGR